HTTLSSFMRYCTGEHAAETRNHVRLMSLIQTREHFRVARGAEPLAIPFQFAAELLVVVDLAVEGDDAGAVKGEHRLRRRVAQIDDREAVMRQPDPAARRQPQSFAIRATRQ